MGSLPRVVDVVHLGRREVRVTFSDGLVRDLDLAPLLRGALAAIDSDVEFGRGHVDHVAGTICWPGGIDLDPDVLHGAQVPATGPAPVVLAESRRSG